MSAQPITEPREERGAFFRLGQLGYKLGQAESDAREQKARALGAEGLVEAVADTLGLDLRTLERIGQAQPEYFQDAHERILDALADWEDDQKVPVCLNCGSPRVDWVEGDFPTGVPGEISRECGWRCQDCGAIEDLIGKGRKEFCSSITNTKRGVNP